MKTAAAVVAMMGIGVLSLSGCSKETHSVEQFSKDDGLRARTIADCRGGKLDGQPAECSRAQDADRLAQRLKTLGQ